MVKNDGTVFIYIQSKGNGEWIKYEAAHVNWEKSPGLLEARGLMRLFLLAQFHIRCCVVKVKRSEN